MKDDIRLKIGSRVHTFARYVAQTKTECSNIYGRNWKTKTVEGSVESLEQRVVNGRKRRRLCCVWAFGQKKRGKTLPLGHIKPYSHPAEVNIIPDREIELTYPLDEAETENEEQPPPETRPTQNQQTSNIGVPHSTLDTAFPDGVVVCHGMSWKERFVSTTLNGAVQPRLWSVRGPDAQIITEGNITSMMRPIDCYTWMFPKNFVPFIVENKNVLLCSNGLNPTSGREILRFFGIIIMMTRFKFGSGRGLWRRGSKHKYIPLPNFGQFMPTKRFEDLRRYISFCANTIHSSAVDGNTDDPRGEQRRWNLCEGFLKAINDHRFAKVRPSQYICVDESISGIAGRWYGKGGSWLSEALPHYVAIDRKPENGCEIQGTACGRSGIMIRLSFVKSASFENQTVDLDINTGTIYMKRLCAPWLGTQRIICADSFFASVEAATELYSNGMRIIGVVKNSSKKYPMKNLAENEMTGRGDHRSMVGTATAGNGAPFDVMAVSWVDRTRRYFVSTTGTSTLGKPQERIRWREDSEGAYQKFVSLDIPSVAEEYYKVAAMTDRHNRTRQDDLDIEKRFRVKEWSLRVNSTLLSVCAVDAYLLYIVGRGNKGAKCPNDFFAELATDLIDNNFDQVGLRERCIGSSESGLSVSMNSGGMGIHLSPTKKRRGGISSKNGYARLQKRCTSCSKKSTWVCSDCRDRKGVEVFVCHSKGQRTACFSLHLSTDHEFE